ncbi:hypothetical protein LOK49_LG09G00789 [Camellia lanceoleosa]|uniref:Uncharacterized protein n=1 Tax=Camellia lanceoleosa TaxID=1840588 RepID=A0ACC0GHB1_9ERIC|nr:hypothetical protein LOK49_LG09G00789 [Camellia lanceoleosa]
MNNENYTWFPYEIGHPNDEAPVRYFAVPDAMMPTATILLAKCQIKGSTILFIGSKETSADVSDVDCILNCDSESVSISANNLEAYFHLPIVDLRSLQLNKNFSTNCNMEGSSAI